MNKKIHSFIAWAMLLMVFSVLRGFATDKNNVFDQSRYNEIVKLYKEKKMMANAVNVKDSDIVNAHIKQLSRTLTKKMALVLAIQATLMGSFAGLTWLGGLASFEGAIGIPGIIKRHGDSAGPTEARIMWSAITLSSLVSAKITQYLYRSRDAFTYFSQSLLDEIKQDEAILNALKDVIKA